MIINLSDQARVNLNAPPYCDEGLTMSLLGGKGSGKSNLIGLIALRHVVLEETKLFFKPSSQSDDFDAVKA